MEGGRRPPLPPPTHPRPPITHTHQLLLARPMPFMFGPYTRNHPHACAHTHHSHLHAQPLHQVHPLLHIKARTHPHCIGVSRGVVCCTPYLQLDPKLGATHTPVCS
jgi:hypothetical protein